MGSERKAAARGKNRQEAIPARLVVREELLEMKDIRTKPGSAAESGSLVDALIERSGAPSASEFEVMQLRRRVHERLAAERRRTPRLAWASAAAAILVVAALGLVVLDGPPGAVPDVPASAAFSQNDDGQVLIQFADGRPVHTVRKRLLTASGANGLRGPETVKRVMGREFVDKNGQPNPGTIVMYVID